AAEVGDEDDPLQLVGADEEVELAAGGLAGAGAGAVCQPGGATRDGPAVVARQQQVAGAELVERLAPATVAAITRQRPDPLRVPALRTGVFQRRQVGAEVDGAQGIKGGRQGVHMAPRSSSRFRTLNRPWDTGCSMCRVGRTLSGPKLGSG